MSDRDKRFQGLSEEQVKPFIYQQTRMIWEKYSVDLLIPMLKVPVTGSLEDVKKENNEVMQLFAKLKKISKPTGDVVGMKLGDLMKFRGLLSSDPAPAPAATTGNDTPPVAGDTDLFPGQGQKIDPQSETRTETVPRANGDNTDKFVYTNQSGIRLGPVVTQKEIENAIVPSLASVVTAQGAPTLQSRRVLTRGFNHGGLVASADTMNSIRVSVIGTAANTPAGSGYSRMGRSIEQEVYNPRNAIRTGKADPCVVSEMQ